MHAFFLKFQSPIIVLNLVGLLVGGGSLFINGESRSVLVGLAIVVLGVPGLLLAMMPSLLPSMMAMMLVRMDNIIGTYVCAFVASLYQAALITIWCGRVTHHFVDQSAASNFIPLLIWSYAVTVSPWTYMGRGNKNSEPTMRTVFFVHVASIVMLTSLFFGCDLKTATLLSAAVMSVEMGLRTYISAQGYQVAWIQLEREVKRRADAESGSQAGVG